MRVSSRSAIVAVALLSVAVGQHISAQDPQGHLTLFGTTGACKNLDQGGPCTTESTLVQLDPDTGGLIKTIGPVGFTVNGLAWDGTSRTLYATTPPGDTHFHGLITIDPDTGVGAPVDASVVNFGLSGSPSPVHSITVDFHGRMAGWYDEFPPPAGVTDTFVLIDQHTGVATEFPNTGINTSQNGLSYSDHDLLWNIDSPKFVNGGLTQNAYLINPSDGKPLLSRVLSPTTDAALGDFNPTNNLYYGLSFNTSFPPPFPTTIVIVDLTTGTVTTLGQTVDDLHTLAFTKGRH